MAQLKADFATAFRENVETVENILKVTNLASEGVTERVNEFNKNLTTALKKPKATLDNHVKNYHSSMKQLFMMDGWRQVVFWMGLWGSIATPILLLINLLI